MTSRKDDDLKFDTLAIHAGTDRADNRLINSCTVPIYQTAAYPFENYESASDLFNLSRGGYFYTRATNPTVAVLEQRLAMLEGGVDAVCTASGMSALTMAIVNLMSQGSHIVASRALYAGNYSLLDNFFRRFGIETTFVDPRDPAAFRAAIRPETRLIFTEVICNPALEVVDLQALADVAHSANVPLMVDATFATPYLCRPFDFGADLVVHSVTKWLGGHGSALGGVIIDSGHFDWEKSGKFPHLCTPGPVQNGTVFTEKFGNQAFPMYIRADALRLVGACMAPVNAFHLLQGLETLSLRMERHCANALRVSEYLEGRAQSGQGVEWVKYPGLKSSPDYTLAQRQLPKGAGSIVTFAIQGGLEQARTFVESLQLIMHASNVGDVRSLALLPGGTTQKEMGDEALEDVGISENWVRLSIGLEDADDIIKDIDRALSFAMASVAA